jgi:hypothetical protein
MRTAMPGTTTHLGIDNSAREHVLDGLGTQHKQRVLADQSTLGHGGGAVDHVALTT